VLRHSRAFQMASPFLVNGFCVIPTASALGPTVIVRNDRVGADRSFQPLLAGAAPPVAISDGAIGSGEDLEEEQSPWKDRPFSAGNSG